MKVGHKQGIESMQREEVFDLKNLFVYKEKEIP
jgi:hypothetical protein